MPSTRATTSEDPPAADAVAPVFLSTQDTAQILGVSRAHVYTLLNERVLQSTYLGKRRLVLKASLDAYVERLLADPEA